MISRLWTGLKDYYKEINPATLSGAIDVIAIQLEDGSYVSTPFHVRFGKTGIFRPREKVVDIYVNKQYVPDIKMKLGEAGEAYFVDQEELEATQAAEAERDAHLPDVEQDLFLMDDLALPGPSADGVPKSSFSDQGETIRPASPCRSDTEVETGESVHRLPQAEVEWKWGEMPVVHRPSIACEPLGKTAAADDLLLKPQLPGPSGDSSDVGYGRCRDPTRHRQRSKSHTCSSPDSFTEESGYRSDSDSKDLFALGHVRMSLCGGLDTASYKPSMDRFLQHLVTYEEYCQDPMTVLNNSDLVVQIGDEFHTWRSAAPQLVSMAAYHSRLTERCLDNLRRSRSPKPVRRGGMRSWFSWGRGRRADPDTDSECADTPPLCSSVPEPRSVVGPHSATDVPAQAASRLQAARQDWFSDTELEREPVAPVPILPRPARRVRLTSEQIAQLNLKEGRNEIVYSVTTQFQGTTRCSCFIYLWTSHDRIVVSDIDGTITKSDVWGQIYTLVGRDWTQAGVCKLFRMIERNGYRIIYLSSRAIGQATLTRDYLGRIRQDGDLTLPNGPVLLNPSSLFHAFHKEVIQRRPEEFKIQCLKDVRSLFPSTPCPLYAGFGNRPSDTRAYVDVGMEFRRCFIVNHRGELKNEMCGVFRSSYSALSEMADLYFPPVNKLTGAEEFADNCYWSTPLPTVTLPEDGPFFDDLDYRQSNASW